MSIDFNYNYPQLAREAGFRLRQYKDGPVDWHLLGSFEIERLMRDQNLEDIDKVLVHLSETPLGSALIDTNILDSGIAKYFIVSQFAIQYLLFCRNFLDETVQELRESHAENQMEIARLKKLLNEANNEILQLHKKMTQMEAIHEVIYPCHLCTKNFANNESLNLHISRKHPNHITVTTTTTTNNANNHRNKPQQGSPKNDKFKDLTLINTIKLELEIKQLKERLNNAEKEIKEHCIANSLNLTPRPTTVVEQRNVAIQSNLSEEKEQNEAKPDENEKTQELVEKQAELAKLQTKIYEIEEWRATQMINNEESIAEINRKLNEISQALERNIVGQRLETPTPQNEASLQEQVESLEHRLSVENLERVLSEKVAEIGKASTEKLTEIVQNLEANYRDKLYELEREVKQVAIASSSKPIDIQPAARIKRATSISTSTPKAEATQKSDAFEEQILEITKSDKDIDDNDNDDDEGTYNIEIKEVQQIKNNDVETIEAKPLKSNTAGQHIFVEVMNKKSKTITQTKPSLESTTDNTDISESLSEDESTPNKFVEDIITKPHFERMIKLKEESEDFQKKKEITKVLKIKKPKSPKKFTRRDVKEMAARRLEKYGLDIRLKSLPQSSLKRVNIEMQEKRNKLKQTYPNFYATRNRIKKFVDKLCSNKLPKDAENLLLNKTALQPVKLSRNFKKQLKEESMMNEESESESEQHNSESETENEIEAKNIKETENEKRISITAKDDFKKRLERLLASPIQQPTSSKANLNQTDELNLFKTNKPMPVPRKRVMFNTASNGGSQI